MKTIVFLCSGGGGNLKFIHSCVKRGVLPDYQIVSVIVDRDCGASKFAEQSGIPTHKVAYSRELGSEMFNLLENYEPDIIITNIHKILDEKLVKRFKNRLINLHYSLLPAFKGTIGEKPVRDALASGCKFVGTTSHFVVEEVDSGEILCQSAVSVVAGQSFEKTMNCLFRVGCFTLLNTLIIISHFPVCGQSNTAEISGFNTCFSPSLPFETGLFDEGFWSEII